MKTVFKGKSLLCMAGTSIGFAFCVALRIAPLLILHFLLDFCIELMIFYKDIWWWSQIYNECKENEMKIKFKIVQIM